MKGTEHVKGLKAKAKALEDSFFAKENERILQELRAASARAEKKKEFQEYLNIDNDEIINALVDLEVEPETLVAFSLVPLVEVAWADGEIQPKEREKILTAARKSRRIFLPVTVKEHLSWEEVSRIEVNAPDLPVAFSEEFGPALFPREVRDAMFTVKQ